MSPAIVSTEACPDRDGPGFQPGQLTRGDEPLAEGGSQTRFSLKGCPMPNGHLEDLWTEGIEPERLQDVQRWTTT